MRSSVYNYVKYVIQRFELEEPILDTCSGWGPSFYKPLFPDKKFLRQDMRDFDPSCVDIVCDITDMEPLDDDSIGTVLNLESLHHVAYPEKALSEIYRVLKPNGLLVLTTHMFWPVMHHPKDYWRFCPHSLELLLSKFKVLDYTLEGDENHPTGLWVTVQKSSDVANLGVFPSPRHVRVPTNWLWYWTVKRPLEKFFSLEIRRLTPESKQIPFR